MAPSGMKYATFIVFLTCQLLLPATVTNCRIADPSRSKTAVNLTCLTNGYHSLCWMRDKLFLKMRQIINKLLLGRCIYFSYKDNRRFAGHSKWANIKHIKQEKDNERMVLFHHLKEQMKIAIQEGGSAKPASNLRLAQLIEQAKKANMSVASIKSFLEKMEEQKDKTQKGIVEIRGPNGYMMLICYTTDNAKKFLMDINHKLKKTSGKLADSSVRNMFTHMGNIIVEKKSDLEQATEDAINIGAEDVEELEENDQKYFLFRCDPTLLSKIKNKLENCQYCVLSAEENYVPHNVIELNESDLKSVVELRNKFQLLEDVTHIYDNIE